MRIQDIVLEGGWASTKTQGTVITPQTIASVVETLKGFEREFNRYLAAHEIPPARVGRPVGSGTYYKRDLESQPDKEYGDIDVQFFIPRIEELTDARNEALYIDKVKEFCERNSDYETTNGVNVIMRISGDEYVQVDLVLLYSHNEKWSHVFAPEHNTKGVLSSTLYSALSAVLNISISQRGVQAKTRNGELVPFAQRKDTKLHTITNDRDNWGVELARWLGAKTISPRLKKFPGLLGGDPGEEGDVKIFDVVQTIAGVLESIGKPELVDTVKAEYLKKIDGVINSSKFDKAETPEAKKKAEETKKMLYTKSRKIAGLLDKL